MRKKGPLVFIGSYLQELFLQKGWNSKLQEYKIWTHWEELVGKQLSSRCQPLKLSHHVLTISVANSTWLTQLQFMKSNLIHKIQQKLQVHIEEIHFKIASESVQENPHISEEIMKPL